MPALARVDLTHLATVSLLTVLIKSFDSELPQSNSVMDVYCFMVSTTQRRVLICYKFNRFLMFPQFSMFEFLSYGKNVPVR